MPPVKGFVDKTRSRNETESGETYSTTVTGCAGDGQVGRDSGRPGPSCFMRRPTRANKPNGYLLGSYRIATAPEPNSSRLTSLKSTRFDSPANNVGPWPANLGCTTNSYSSINPSSANASGSFTPPINSP